jgi:hypothetical protein
MSVIQRYYRGRLTSVSKLSQMRRFGHAPPPHSGAKAGLIPRVEGTPEPLLRVRWPLPSSSRSAAIRLTPTVPDVAGAALIQHSLSKIFQRLASAPAVVLHFLDDLNDPRSRSATRHRDRRAIPAPIDAIRGNCRRSSLASGHYIAPPTSSRFVLRSPIRAHCCDLAPRPRCSGNHVNARVFELRCRGVVMEDLESWLSSFAYRGSLRIAECWQVSPVGAEPPFRRIRTTARPREPSRSPSLRRWLKQLDDRAVSPYRISRAWRD